MVSPSNAAAIPGWECNPRGKVVYEYGFKYTCVAAPKSLKNPFGKKSIWKQIGPASLETAYSDQVRLQILNALNLGYWKKTPINGFQGKRYTSNYPCFIYISPNFDDMLSYWNYEVNQMFYKGAWVAIQSKMWIVNDVSSDQECIKYFAYKYGGTIKYQY